jgi:predicted MFS family arabinose efflux permease
VVRPGRRWRQAHLLVGGLALVLAAAVLATVPPMPPDSERAERATSALARC